MVYMYIIMCKFVRGIKPMQCRECVVAKPLSESVRQDIDQILTLKGFFKITNIFIYKKFDQLRSQVLCLSLLVPRVPSYPSLRSEGERTWERGWSNFL